MKNIIIVIVVLSMFLIACTSPQPIYVPGVYLGVAEGYHSNLTVEVITDDYGITSIEIIEEDETPIIAEIVYEEIPRAVIKANSINVDVVAGATYTSETLLAAIEDGLHKARLIEDTPRGINSEEER